METTYNSLAQFMQALFGVYQPNGYEDASGNFVVASGFAGVDWQYVLSVAIFCLVVYCLFKLLGGIICKS